MAISDWLRSKFEEEKGKLQGLFGGGSTQTTAAPAPATQTYVQKKLGGSFSQPLGARPIVEPRAKLDGSGGTFNATPEEARRAAIDLAVGMGQSFGRSVVGIGAGILSGGDFTKKIDPSGNRISRALLGDRPFSIASEGSDTGTAFGVPEGIAKSPYFAIPIGGLLAGSDVFTFGGSGAVLKNIARGAKAVAEIDNVADATRAIEQSFSFVPVERRAALADTIVAAKDAKTVRAALESEYAMSRRAAAGAAPADIAKADEIIGKRVAAQKAAVGAEDGFAARMRQKGQSFYDEVVDRAAALTRLARAAKTKEATALADEIDDAADMTFRSEQIAEVMRRDTGFAELTSEVRNIDYDKFNQYAIARHNMTLDAYGIEKGLDTAEDAIVVSAYKDQFESLASRLTEITRKMLDMQVESGRISGEFRDYLRQRYPDYVPMNVLFDESLSAAAKSGNTRAIASAAKDGIVRKITGSKRAIANPLETLHQQFSTLAHDIAQNNAASAIVRSMDTVGNPLQVRALDTLDTVARRRELIGSMSELKAEREALKKIASRRKKELASLRAEIQDISTRGQKRAARAETAEAGRLERQVADGNRKAMSQLMGKTPKSWADVPDIPVQTADGKSVSLRARLRERFVEIPELLASVRAVGLDEVAKAADLPVRTVAKATEGARASAAFRGTFDPTSQPWFDEVLKAKGVDDLSETIASLAPKQFQQLRTVLAAKADEAAGLRRSAAERKAPGTRKALPAREDQMVRDRRADFSVALDELGRVGERIDQTVSINRMSREEVLALAKGKLEDGEDVIFRTKGGVREVYAVPQEVAEAAKGLGAAQIDLFTRSFGAFNRFRRLFISQLNPIFQAANLVRDYATSIIFTDTKISNSAANPALMLRAIWATIKKNDDFYDAVRAGSTGTMTESLRTTKEVREHLLWKSKNAHRSLAGRAIATVTNPKALVRSIEDALSIGEQSTRVANYLGARREALAMGMSLADANRLAGRNARNATVNFLRKGKAGPQLNAMSLFLGANIQGARLTVNAFKRHPARTARRVALFIGMPTAMVTAYNLMDDERRRIYDKEVSPFEKENNLVLVLPGARYDEVDGRWKGIIKIPVSPGLPKEAMNIGRILLESAHAGDEPSFKELAKHLVNTVSPIEPTEQGFGSFMASTALGPFYENAANYKYFEGRPIVSDQAMKREPYAQYTDSTSGTAKFLAGSYDGGAGAVPLAGSPAKTDAFVKGYLGGSSAGLLTRLSDKLLAASGQIPEKDVKGLGFAEALGRRFTSAAGGESERQATNAALGYETDESTAAFELKEQAKAELSALSKLDPEAQNARMGELISTNPALARKVLDEMKDASLGLTSTDKAVKNLGVKNGTRADYIRERLAGMSEEEQNEYMLDLIKKKLVTREVLKQITSGQ